MKLFHHVLVVEILSLVIALASKPKVEAFELINPATYPADDSIGTEMSTDLLVVVEFTVKVYACSYMT